MKAKIIISVLTALVMSACSSSYMAKSGNDDLYYTPGKGSSIPQSQTENTNVSAKNFPSAEKRSSSQMTDYEKYRASMENRELADSAGQTYADTSNMQNVADSKEPVVESDEYYGEGGDSYVYNNYYYANRLNRFHGGFYDPFFYDPFYFDSWYSPGWSFSIGWGWGYPYYDYYYPYGYWGYYGYNPYYGHRYGYFDYYGYGYGRWGGSYSSDRKYGRIPNRSNLTNTPYGRRSNTTGYISNNSVSREKSTRMGSTVGSSRGGSTSPSGRRYTNDNVSTSRGSSERSVYTRRAPVDNNGAVMSGRRYDNPGAANRRTEYNENSRNSGRTYTPTYSKPRNYSRASYNESSSSNSYSGGRNSSSSPSSQSYSRPSSSSNSSPSSSGSSYRRTSNETYSRPAPSYTPSSSNSGSSYSGSSSSSRSSSGGSSSGGGNSGSRRR